MWLSKEINEKCSSQWTDILSPKSILPFYSQVANLTGIDEDLREVSVKKNRCKPWGGSKKRIDEPWGGSKKKSSGR